MPAFLSGVAERYGPIASWRMPRARFWFVDDAALVETVLTASGYDLVKGRGLQRMRRLLGQGLLTSDEPLHLKQRRLVQPAFHRERVTGYAATMIEVAARAGGALRPGETVTVDALMNRVALRIAAATLFSADVDDEADAIGRGVTDAMAAFPASISAFGELLDHVPFHPATRRFRAAREQLDAVIFKLIADRRRTGADHGDLLSILLSSRDDDGTAMPDELVRDEALTLLLAGHETTANALTWTWDALARHPEAEARLHAELDLVLGDRDPTP
ncbi:MAG TPA: cytochrome P450, partial [Candidatus Elarobacter sp.]